MTAFRCLSDAAARAAAGVVLALAAACACAQAYAPAPAPASAIATPDPRITSAARLLAGVGSAYEPHAHVASLDAWAKHRETLAPQWDRLRRERLSVIEDWRDDVLGAGLDRCRTLLYPFSGPDFLNAYLLFPRCDTYVFFGLERPGEVPPLETMTRDDAAALLKDVRVALGDILVRNYFITQPHGAAGPHAAAERHAAADARVDGPARRPDRVGRAVRPRPDRGPAAQHRHARIAPGAGREGDLPRSRSSASRRRSTISRSTRPTSRCARTRSSCRSSPSTTRA